MVNFAKLQLLQNSLSSNLGPKIDSHAIEKWSSILWSITGRKKCNRGEPFTMMFPPPNITGNLHLGHALTGTIQDAFVRYHSMRGRDVKWIPGFDHAGLATQSIVEKLTWKELELKRTDLDRVRLFKEASRWKDLKRQEMRSQLDRLGLALDYDQEYFTMDNKSSRAVQIAFKKLFESGVIYRAAKDVFWSKEQGTTLSDIEVDRVGDVYRYFRTGEIVERKPLLQWFIDAKTMAHRAVEVVENSSIDILPPNYKNSWVDWLTAHGVEDWCISRQGWWGHSIPAYRRESSADIQESWIVADSMEEAINKLGDAEKVVRDSDVLDTWFSSSLLPLTISGWPDKELFASNCEKGYFPLHIMETGFDILNFWVSKMVMMSLELENRIPFNLILLHGMICDSNGKKMSKTKGNVIDPLDVINGAKLIDMQQRTQASQAKGIMGLRHLEDVLANQKKIFPNGIPACGADGLRAYLLSHDVQEEIVRIRINQIEKIRRLSNKIWNVYRYVLTLLKDVKDLDLDAHLESSELDESDLRVLSELAFCLDIARKSFEETYQLHHLFGTVEIFWTKHLSSVYIGDSKSALNQSNEGEKVRKIKVLVKCLDISTKLLHPIMPHLTEFLYQKLKMDLKKSSPNEPIKSIGQEQYPSVSDIQKYLNNVI